jgi:hypothetical protein
MLGLNGLGLGVEKLNAHTNLQLNQQTKSM